MIVVKLQINDDSPVFYGDDDLFSLCTHLVHYVGEQQTNDESVSDEEINCGVHGYASVSDNLNLIVRYLSERPIKKGDLIKIQYLDGSSLSTNELQQLKTDSIRTEANTTLYDPSDPK